MHMLLAIARSIHIACICRLLRPNRIDINNSVCQGMEEMTNDHIIVKYSFSVYVHEAGSPSYNNYYQ